MEPPPPRQRRQWAVGNERITLAELAAAGVKTPERDHWPHSHPFDHPPSRTTHSAGSSKAEALFQDRRTSAESHLDSRRTSEKRVSDGGVRAREQGFNLQLSGANEERVKAQLKRQVQGGGRRSSGNGGGTEEEHRRRRNWQRAQQLVIRTDDGAALPVEESTGGRKSRGEGEVEGATGAVKAGGKGDGADSEKDGSRSMRVKVLEEACGHMESDERRKGGSGERDATEEGREFEQRENGDEGKRRGARHVAEDQGRDDEADFTVVQEMVEPDAMEPPFETDLSVAESPHSEKHVVNVDGKGTRAETGATVRASVSYESEDFEAYEESFEEDLSLGDEGAQTERADAETPLRVASKSNPPNRETLAQLPLESPPSVSVPPLETVDSPDMIRSFDAKSARFGDAGPSFRPAEGNGTGGTGTVAGSVTYSSVQDWGMARSETFGSMEVVDVSEEADVGEPDVSVTANLRPSVVKREELEVEEIEEEDLSEEGISEVGSPGSAQLEQESGAVSEESDSNSEEPVPTVTRSERFVEPNLSPAVESPRATFAGSPLGKPGRVRPLSALSSRIPAEPVPRAPLTARNGSKPGTDVSLVLEAVRRENAKALAAQKERLTEGRTEERKSGTEAERRKSGTEAERWKIGTEGERRTSGTDELEAGFLMKEGPARRPSKDWEQETVAQRQDGLFTNGLRVAQMQSFKEKPTKPLLPELNERLRLLDTQKQEYLLEVIQKLERCQAPKELQNPQVPKELRNPQGAIGETGSTVLGHGKVGDVSEVAGRRAAELAPQVDGKDGEPYRQPSMAIKQTGVPSGCSPKSAGREMNNPQPLTPETRSALVARSSIQQAPQNPTAQIAEHLESNPQLSQDSPSPRAGRRRSSTDGEVKRTTSIRGEPVAESLFNRAAVLSRGDEIAPNKVNYGPRGRAGTRSPFLNVITTDTPSPTSSPESVFGVTSSSGQPGKGRRGKATETEQEMKGGHSLVERNDAQGATDTMTDGSSRRSGSGSGSGSAIRQSRRSSLGPEGRSAVGFGARLSAPGEGSPQEEPRAQRVSGRRSVNRTSDGDLRVARASEPSKERQVDLNRGYETARANNPVDIVSPGIESPTEAVRRRGRPRVETPGADSGGEAPEGFRRKGRARGAPSVLEQSLDSLAFFRHSHAGRLHIPAEPLPSPAPLLNVNTPGLEGTPGAERHDEADSELGVPASGRKSMLGGTESETGLQRAGIRPPPQAETKAVTGFGMTADILAEPRWLPPPGPEVRPKVGGATIDRGTEVDTLSSFVHPAESLPAPEEPRGKQAQAPLPIPTFFTIPCEPRGSQLTVNILENWGDPFYVGLSGLEIFDSAGEPLSSRSLRAEPPDLNILSGYGSDPRTVDKLLDGVNWTCDDLHHWLAPFTPGEAVSIHVSFDDVTTLGMIRVWNYNCSRIHSFRGARTIEVRLDDRVIFVGEVRKAPGIMEGALRCAECLLFTESENALSALEIYDLKRYSDTANALKAAAETSGSVVESLDLDRF